MSGTVAKRCYDYWLVTVDGYHRLPCHCDACKGALFNPANTRWEADHRIPRAHGGSDDPPNVRPMKYACHRLKTEKQDIPAIAKGKRQAARVFGIKRSRGFYKPKGMKFDWSSGKYIRVREET